MCFRRSMVPASKLLIVDDNAVVRDALGIVLEPCDDFTVCAEAKSAHEAITRAEDTKPDIALVDLSLKGDDGLSLIGQLRALRPEMRIVVYSLHDEMYYIATAKNAGADGYVIKSEKPKVLIETLRRVLSGQSRFPETDSA